MEKRSCMEKGKNAVEFFLRENGSFSIWAARRNYLMLSAILRRINYAYR